MVKGRKPDASAVRRKKTPPTPEVLIAEVVEETPALPMPAQVAGNSMMAECWNMVVGDGYQFTPADIPQLEQLCYWYAVFRQCEVNTVNPSGTISTCSENLDGVVKANPDIRIAKEASTMYRMLASELGVDPLARQRMGLMDAVTRSTQADLVRKTEDLFARFQKRCLDAPK